MGYFNNRGPNNGRDSAQLTTARDGASSSRRPEPTNRFGRVWSGSTACQIPTSSMSSISGSPRPGPGQKNTRFSAGNKHVFARLTIQHDGRVALFSNGSNQRFSEQWKTVELDRQRDDLKFKAVSDPTIKLGHDHLRSTVGRLTEHSRARLQLS